jgi:hypothetical protein
MYRRILVGIVTTLSVEMSSQASVELSIEKKR